MSRENGRHFTQIDTADGSAFTNKFPVDLRNPTIKDIVTHTIPEALDDVFLLRGSHEEYATVAKKGVIPLAPLRLQKESDKEGDQFIFRVFTAGKAPELTHLLYERDNGFITDFSIVVRTMDKQNRASFYDLRGSLEHENGEGPVFEIVEMNEDGAIIESLSLVEETAHSLVAAINEQRGGGTKDQTLQSMLTEIMDASPAVLKNQAKEYENQASALNVSIEREERITRGIGNLASYMVAIDEEGITNPETGVRITRGFMLNYKQDRSPRYEAVLSSFTYDPNKSLSRIERANGYEALSSGLRAKPEIIFKALSIAVTSLLSIND